MQHAHDISQPVADGVAHTLQIWFGHCASVSARIIDGSCSSLPEEESYIRSAAPSRREEFLTGRWCARDALSKLGVPASPILVGCRREPLWPIGVVGTITHGAGLAAAVVGRVDRWRGIGIDILEIESAVSLLREADGLIASETEERQMKAITQGVDARVLLFSAKESVIKAISTSLQRFVDFMEIYVTLYSGYFEASCVALNHPVRGRWQATDKVILTAAIALAK
jgi:4'-phosphopantetheinyl transferase EntD